MSPSERRSQASGHNSPKGESGVIVAVFGAAFLPEDGTAFRSAYDLGAQIARRGWTLASGGYGGTMAAASRGAVEAGGHTLGVTCEPLTRSGRATNAWIREEIHCPTLRERLLTLVRTADASIALDGGLGTLAEIAFCAMQIQTGELSPRPLLLMGTVWEETFQSFFRSAASYLKGPDVSIFGFVQSPLEATRIIQEFLDRKTPASR
jgi:uncharacterized protein (TIGR00730 family)